jgi:hypothetical protein
MTVTGFLTFRELISIVSSNERTIEYLMDIGLIKSYDDPPYCKKWSQGIACELKMKIGNVSKLIDGKRWKCTKYCNGSKEMHGI